ARNDKLPNGRDRPQSARAALPAAGAQDPQGAQEPRRGRSARGRMHRSALADRHPQPAARDRRCARGGRAGDGGGRIPDQKERIANGEWRIESAIIRYSPFAIRVLHRHKKETAAMAHRCAILDDYQNVALKLADWGQLKGEVDVRVYNESLGDQANVIS